MAIKLSCLFVFLKLLIFRFVITQLGMPQIATDHTSFVKKIPGEHAPEAP